MRVGPVLKDGISFHDPSDLPGTTKSAKKVLGGLDEVFVRQGKVFMGWVSDVVQVSGIGDSVAIIGFRELHDRSMVRLSPKGDKFIPLEPLLNRYR